MNNSLQLALSIANTYLTNFAKSADFWQDFEVAFGSNYDKKIALNIKNSLATKGVTPPEIVIVDSQVLGTAEGAYATENNTIYLSKEFLEQNDSQRVAITIIEEIGHAIDSQINTQDSAGDEGQIFSRLVIGSILTPTQLASLKAENDQAIITVGGQQLSVEQANITGTDSDDYNLNGTVGNDIINAGAGNDYIDGGGGSDTIDGGYGIDSITFNLAGSTADITVNLDSTTGSVVFSGTTFTTKTTGIERFQKHFSLTSGLTTGSGNDVIISGEYEDTINSGAGNDTVTGGGGGDTIHTAEGNDIVNGGGGDWIYTEAGNDTVNGGDRDFIYTGTGNDTVNGSGGGGSIETEAGDDTVNGGGGDVINTGAGNDIINAKFGDIVKGGSGNDVLSLSESGYFYGLTGNSLNGYDGYFFNNSNSQFISFNGIERFNIGGTDGSDNISGTSGDNILNGGIGADTMAGGTGNDTYIVDNVGDIITETSTLATEIDNVQSSVTYTISANVENLILTGTTTINGTGNDLNNTLTGNTASNTLNGLTGADTMIGGTGNDTYVVDNAGDIVTEASTLATEIDNVQSSVTHTLGANVENVTLTGTAVINGTGNELNNTLTGNGSNNTLTGAAGNDTLNGLAGADTMIGGTGNDAYIVDNLGDIVTETSTLANEIDTVQSSATYTIGTNVEKLTLTGTAAINGTGNALNNTLTGNTGNNILNGLAGVDTMIGGTGNDTYVVDNIGDIVTEASILVTEIDTVQSSITYTLGTNVEKLTLTGTAAINGTGNALNNTLTGNSGNNILNGLTGVDTMIGNTGNDTYIVDNTADVVTETSTLATEIDTIQSSVTYSLGANVEHLTLTGTAAINATGNALNNTLTGNSAANTLNGGDGIDYLIGGVGNDILNGGNGTDVYIIDADIHSGTDTINETATGGIDVLDFRRSATAVAVDLSKNTAQTVAINVQLVIPVMTLENVYGGTGNDTLTGNTLNNTLYGGAGNDTLKGGGGIDSFLFSGGALSGVNTVSSLLGKDTISDFATGDKILLSKTTFSAITSAAYTPIGTNFAMVANDGLVGGSAAAIVYSQASKNLFYNQNGAAVGYGNNGGSFATLTGVASVAAGDFTIVG